MMSESGTRSSAAEILIQLDRAAPVPLRAQLERTLRELIRSGRLRAGELLPSSRTLAADLGVSRRLVVEAYDQLAAEGYLSSHERSATRVGNVSAAAAAVATDEPPSVRYDLRPGVPALGEFPRPAWLRATAHALRHAPDAALAYPDPRGTAALRQAIAAYLRRVRAVDAEPQRIVICTGFRQGLSLLTRALGRPVVARVRRPLLGAGLQVRFPCGGLHARRPGCIPLGGRAELGLHVRARSSGRAALSLHVARRCADTFG